MAAIGFILLMAGGHLMGEGTGALGLILFCLGFILLCVGMPQ